MEISWVSHACLCTDVKLVEEAAYLCPKTAPDGKTDTWIYVAVAVLGLPVSERPTGDEIMTMRKALRGCYPPKSSTGTSGKTTQKSTMHNTGLNRAPCNLLSTVDQRYIFDSSAYLYVRPVMNLNEAKAWDGGSYSVLILCDNEKYQRSTH